MPKLTPHTAILILAGALTAAAAPTSQQILAKSKEAMGGSAWDAVKTAHITAAVSMGGLNGRAETWEDVRSGRHTEKFALGPATGADGFDGKNAWSQDASGQPRAEGAEAARQAAVDEAYRDALAYWYPQRWAADLSDPVEKDDQDKHFFVIRITPKGGRPFELWIDAATYLFDRTIEKGDIETRTISFTDYRAVNGTKVAFAMRSTNGETRYDQTIALERVEYNVPVQDAAFRIPAPPPPDFSIAGGQKSTAIPFELINNHIYLQVKLNGKGPFRLLCDTGGMNIITPEMARELNVKPEGALQGQGVGDKSEDIGLVKMQSVRVGGATLENQLFAVFPMAPFAAVEGIPINGLVGYEVFKRFVVKIDYEHQVLTLNEPASFAYKGNGIVVPFQFNEHIPQVEGEIDGMRGKFDIDTGSRASLDLMSPFVAEHDLKSHYHASIETTTGWGVGGAARSALARGQMLKLGKVEVPNLVTELSVQTKGAFSSPYVAGNVGGGVLKRFNITFDYPHQQLIFEPNANAAKPDVYDRSGMWLNLSGEAFEVMDVAPSTPAAAANLKAGDKILAADGRPASQIPLAEMREKLRGDPGTKVHLTVQSGDQKREVELVLKDLV